MTKVKCDRPAEPRQVILACIGSPRLSLPTRVQANFASSGPRAVASYPFNAWGLYDMPGNIGEWCSDWFGDYPQGEAVDPKGPDRAESKAIPEVLIPFALLSCRPG